MHKMEEQKTIKDLFDEFGIETNEDGSIPLFSSEKRVIESEEFKVGMDILLFDTNGSRHKNKGTITEITSDGFLKGTWGPDVIVPGIDDFDVIS